MGIMSVYSEGNPPIAGSVTEKQYCKSQSIDTPYDTLEIRANIKTIIDNYMSDMDGILNEYRHLVKELSEDWGAKFIKINGKELGFVDVEAYNTLLTHLDDVMKEMKSNVNEFLDSIEQGEAGVKENLKRLYDNWTNNVKPLYKERNELHDKLRNLEYPSAGDTDYYSKLMTYIGEKKYYDGKLKSVNEKIESFKEVKNPVNDVEGGKWIVN